MHKKVDKVIKHLVSKSDTDKHMSDVMKEFEEKKHAHNWTFEVK